MRNENEIWYNTFAIVREPGDGTRYEYMVHRDGPDEFCFMPMKSTFRFPQRLNYFDVKDIELDTSKPITEVEELFVLAHKENCNPYTLRECIRTVKILHERKMK